MTNKRLHRRYKKKILTDKKHLGYLVVFVSFVLVPADKASNNVLVVRRKFVMFFTTCLY